MIPNLKTYLQTNYVEKHLQNALLPVNLLQYTSFLSKYTIRNNFIYPKGYIYYILAFFFTCILIHAHYAHSKIDGILDNPKYIHTTINLSIIFNFVSYCCDGILLFISNIYSSKFAVTFVLKVQKITESLRCISNNCFKIWQRENWIYVGGIYLAYLLTATMFAIIFHYEYISSISRLAYVFALLYYDVNIICAFRYVKLCEDCLRLWIANVRIYSKRSTINDSAINKMDEYYFKKLLDAYFEILNSFDMIKIIFQLPILLQIVDSFLHGLIYAQLFIEIGKEDIINNTSGTGVLAETFVFGWITKNVVILSFCIKGCEDFYISIIAAERSCVMHLGNYKHPELKKLYKNVIRINRAKFGKMTACGVLIIDATLPLKLFDQWAVYITVLLQFAFY